MTPHPNWPWGLDYSWLGVDDRGQVARFVNFGNGPIPIAVLDLRPSADRRCYLIDTLPVVSACELLVNVPDPREIEQVVGRGVFSYDWYAPREAGDLCDEYRIEARPTSPITVDALPEEVQRFARLVVFREVDFAKHEALHVEHYAQCWR